MDKVVGVSVRHLQHTESHSLLFPRQYLATGRNNWQQRQRLNWTPPLNQNQNHLIQTLGYRPCNTNNNKLSSLMQLFVVSYQTTASFFQQGKLAEYLFKTIPLWISQAIMRPPGGNNSTDSLQWAPVQPLQQRGVVCSFSVGTQSSGGRQQEGCWCYWASFSSAAGVSVCDWRCKIVWRMSNYLTFVVCGVAAARSAHLVVSACETPWQRTKTSNNDQRGHRGRGDISMHNIIPGNMLWHKKHRSRHMNSCWTEVTNKALDQYLFICRCVVLPFELSKHVSP